MSTDLRNIIRNDFFSLEDKVLSRKYAEDARMKICSSLGIDVGESHVWEEKYDGYCWITITISCAGMHIHIDLGNGFWFIDPGCRFWEVLCYYDGEFKIRRILYFIAKALGQSEVWHIAHMSSLDFDPMEETSKSFDDFLIFINEWHPEGIPEFDEALFRQICIDGFCPSDYDYEHIYHDNFQDYRLNEPEQISPEIQWRWCLVGNIVQTHKYGENGESRIGTKHFSPGTKVFCAPGQWGDGYENIVVIGHPRHRRQFIEIVMPKKHIENFRIKKVFNPQILNIMRYSHYCWWKNTQSDHDDIVGMIKSMKEDGIPVKEPIEE